MIGTQVANYRIDAKLGEGGMGVVYRAMDMTLDRRVAIKFLAGDLARDPALIERFQSEAKAQANLNHTNIATLYTFLHVNGNCLIVMEYVEGETFDQTIRRRGLLPSEEAIPLFKQALLGIGFAHRMGIIHRDIKPSNLMVNRHGIVKVMDFGIAKVLGGRRVTRTGMQVGTVFYMSPEQIRNQTLDIRSDIYSLGVTLYEMLSAHVPFESDSDFQVMADHVNTPPPLPTRHYPYISKGIEQAVLKALAKSPDTRFQTVEEFGAALEHPEVIAASAPQPLVVGAAAGAVAGASAALSATQHPVRPSRLPVGDEAVSEHEPISAGLGAAVRNWVAPRKLLVGLAGFGAMSLIFASLAIHYSRPEPRDSTSRELSRVSSPPAQPQQVSAAVAAEIVNADKKSPRSDLDKGSAVAVAATNVRTIPSFKPQHVEPQSQFKSMAEIQSLMDQRNYSEAINDLKGLTAAQPNNAAAHGLLAKAFIHERQFSLAVDEAKTSLRLNRTTEAGATLALAYYDAHRYQDAESAALSVRADENNNQTALEVLAGASFWTGKDDWRQYASRLKDVAPNSLWPLALAGVSEFNVGHRDSAISNLESAKNAQFRDPAPYQLLVSIYMQAPDIPRAKLESDSALAAFPDNPGLLAEGTFVSLLSKNLPEAERRMAQLEHLAPDGKETARAACVYYYGTEQRDAALRTCSQLATIDDGNPTSHSNYAWALLDANQFPLAFSEFSRAYELQKNKTSSPLETIDLYWGLIIDKYFSGDKKSAGDLLAKLKQGYPKFVSANAIQQLPLVWSRTTLQRVEEITKDIGETAQVKSYPFYHRHVVTDANLNVSQSYCTGNLTITPDGTVRFDCTQTNDPQGRCDHVAFPRGSIKEIKLNRDGSLHIATYRSGNYDFYGEASAIQDTMRSLEPLAARRK